MGQNLYELVELLAASGPNGKRLRRHFLEHPESLAKDLTPQARLALYKMDRTQAGPICAHVKNEFIAEGKAGEYSAWEDWILAWNFPGNEFVPKGNLPADCQVPGGGGPAYPDPKPLVFRINPNTLSIANGNKQDLEVIGQGFVTGRVRLELRNQANNSQLTVTNRYSGIEGNFRCGHLYAKVTMPAAAGTYDIRVILTTGADGAGNPVEYVLPVYVDPNTGIPIALTITL